MKQPWYLGLGLLMMGSGFVLVLCGMVAVGAALSVLGIFLIIDWNTRNYRWVCSECGEEFDITRWQNFIGLNGGINYKLLRCPRCGRRTWCQGK